jgi:dTDP-4-amino-4,6-dideoxygalactose transaminase
MEPYKNNVCSDCDCLNNTNIFSKKIFSLPMYPYLGEEKQDKVIKVLKSLL